jgi:hypothetical protein
MLNFLYDDGLRRPAFIWLRGTDGEISKQSWLAIRAIAIEVMAYQFRRLRICRKKDVMSSDMPDLKEAISSVPNRSAVNLEATLRRSRGAKGHYQKKTEDIDSTLHGGRLTYNPKMYFNRSCWQRAWITRFHPVLYGKDRCRRLRGSSCFFMLTQAFRPGLGSFALYGAWFVVARSMWVAGANATF